ncbi:ATP-binding cassette domain-containing protein [Actinobaculum sp. 313]|uniref:ATP-binding cassette domain-containing protein n=1 Tax=Actinobaculum sp. 313 TaxID=2495645 RepID=UPI001F0BA0A0|nr:ATP-binding cassette domain-containing protein [Actinobaculum sp. 313]
MREQGEKNRGAIMRLLAGNQVVIIVMDGLFSLALICCTAAVTVARVHAGAVTVSQALTIMLLAALLLEPLVQVAGFFYIGMGGMAAERAIGRYLSSAERAVSETTAAESSTTGVAATGNMGKQSASTVQATASEASTATADAAALAGEFPAVDPALAIQADHLTYDYGRGPVLHGIDLAVPQGGKVAIVGRSGAGKSTLLALLRGSQPLQGGRLLLGGENAADHNAAWIRRQSASVAQTTWLFTTTIAENLRLARPDATEEEMWAALRKAHVAEDIERMPLGLNTPAGEEGALISGGQAQRLSLARAFLSGRRILLLDEPTSQIDMESEAHIINAITELDHDWTVLIVTHRPSLLRLADSVWELDGGVLRAYADVEKKTALRTTATEGER